MILILGKVGRQAKWNKKALPPAANKHVSPNAPIPNYSFVPCIMSCIHLAVLTAGKLVSLSDFCFFYV